jgi:cell division protein FtsB
MASVRNTIFLELRIIKEYWQIISVATTVIFFGVYFYLENKDAREEVKELTQTNKELKDRISRLEGQIDVINSNMVLFVERNPGLTSYRLEMLEEQMDVRQIIDGLNRSKSQEIKIIQVPVPTVQVIKEVVPQKEEEKKYEVVTTKPQEKKGLFKKN